MSALLFCSSADVLKHSILSFLFHHFSSSTSSSSSSSPFFYFDSHSSTPYFDLQYHHSQQTKEFQSGIQKLWKLKSYPAALEPYLSAVRAINLQYPFEITAESKLTPNQLFSYEIWKQQLTTEQYQTETSLPKSLEKLYQEKAFQTANLKFYPGKQVEQTPQLINMIQITL